MTAKDAYVQKIEGRLEEIDAEINRLKAMAKQANADAQIEYTRHLSDLRERREGAQRKLHELRDASGGALDDVQAGMENAWKDLKSAMDRAKSRFQ